jgi:hypothetical protein
LLNTSEGKQALTRLAQRGVQDMVAIHSAVGVVPSEFDFGRVGAAIRAEQDRLLALKASRPQGRPSKEQKASEDAAQRTIDRLESLQRDLRACIEQAAGGLCFFYADAEHQITGMNIFTPDEKRHGWVGTDGLRGVFNHGLFAQFRTWEEELLPPTMLVTLDEFALLRVQSVYVRAVGEIGHPTGGYILGCALGDRVDAATLRAVCRTPLVIHEDGSAGADLIDTLRQELNLTATKVPSGSLTAYLRAAQDQIVAMRDMIASRRLLTRPLKNVRLEVDAIRSTENRQLRSFESNRIASRMIITDLRERGQLFHDRLKPFIFLTQTNEVVPADPDSAEFRALASQYGVSAKDSLFKNLLEALDIEGLALGVRTPIHDFAYFDERRVVLYLFDFNRWVYRISAEKVEKVPNGTDGVLFVRNPRWESWEMLRGETGDTFVSAEILRNLRLDDDQLTREDAVLLLEAWIYTLFFPNFFATKIIGGGVGPAGSGKTSLFELVGRIIFGSKFHPTPLPNDAQDLDAILTNEAFVLLDNADKRKEWLEDRLAVAATGGSIRRRRYFTTNELADFPVRASVALTSRTPHFRREDVADRLLLFRVARLEPFVAKKDLLKRFDNRRDLYMTRLVRRIPAILKRLRETADAPVETKFRMADFGGFLIRVAPVFGRDVASIEATLARVVQVQRRFSAEDDSLVDLIGRWLTNSNNDGRQISTGELFAELQAEAKGDGAHPPTCVALS